jgi:E3 ubiquitin-protein ligase SHPRH
MVGNSTAAAAAMARRLEAHYRWAVTGTPLSRGLEDLYGLLYFLHFSPLDDHVWWLRVCQEPYENKSPAGGSGFESPASSSMGFLFSFRLLLVLVLGDTCVVE